MHTVLRQADPDGVAQPIEQKGSYPDRTLDSSILPVAGLRHPEVQRVVPVGPFFG